MNKTVNINLAGIFFHIDEDAYLKLQRYLDAIKRSFTDSQGRNEIISDIEAAFACTITILAIIYLFLLTEKNLVIEFYLFNQFTVFEIFSNFPFLGDDLNVLHILLITQGKRMYIVKGWKFQ